MMDRPGLPGRTDRLDSERSVRVPGLFSGIRILHHRAESATLLALDGPAGKPPSRSGKTGKEPEGDHHRAWPDFTHQDDVPEKPGSNDVGEFVQEPPAPHA